MNWDFQIGDRVEVIHTSPSGATDYHLGLTGVVVYADLMAGRIGVHFDESPRNEDGIPFGHSCGGRIREGHGWYCDADNLVPEAAGVLCSVDDLL